MNLAWLKKLRIAVSLLFFGATAFLYMDFTHSLATALFAPVTYLEFIPSLLKFIAQGTFAAAGCIIVLCITSFFGRVYCSTVCPLGTLQDFISHISMKWKKNKKYKFSRPLNLLRYSILISIGLLFVFGIILGVTILDPYSIFGRITSQLFKPVVIGINNLAASILKNLNAYWMYPVEIKGFYSASLILPLVMIGVVGWLSATKGRVYCNSLCPVGTLLGFMSRYSFLKIKIDRTTCDNCGKCGIACKASCINVQKKDIDFSRCVGCFNCFAACPTNSMTFAHSSGKRKSTMNPDNSHQRRSFLLGVGAYILGYSGIAYGQTKVKVYTHNTVPVFKKFALSPPGSVSIARFNEKCTACNLCVSACPAQVLQPSWFEYGVTGMFQPRLDTVAAYCTYECTICGEVCPTGAILRLPLEQKKLTQLGKAKFVKENCVVETQKTECGACSEHCPTKAVHMIPYKGLFLPEVRDEYCIGCGACEYSCPTVPYKAIYVDGNAVHQKAEKPKEEKLEQKIDTKNDFPF
jgi:ferredoxin